MKLSKKQLLVKAYGIRLVMDRVLRNLAFPYYCTAHRNITFRKRNIARKELDLVQHFCIINGRQKVECLKHKPIEKLLRLELVQFLEEITRYSERWEQSLQSIQSIRGVSI